MSSYSAEIISIGNEVLSGRVINGNAQYISRELKKVGCEVKRHTVIPDDHAIIIETFAESMACAPLVIATGGLGPTLDDMTRQAAAELFNSPCEYNESIAHELESRFGEALPSLRDQATQPRKALILKNRLGTASGLIFYDGRSSLILLPGVPIEMQTLFNEEVLPYLKGLFHSSRGTEEAWLYFANLYESQVDPLLRIYQEGYPALKMGIYPSNGLLSIHLEGEGGALENVRDSLKKELKEFYYSSSDGKIETAIQEYFIQHHLSLSIAESCTGGAVAARLVTIPGSSQYLLGAVIAYSNAMKQKLLGVPIDLINKHGAVSSEVVSAMADGIQLLTDSDYAIATTGIAGPSGGSLDKPVGTVYAAIKQKGQPVMTYHLEAKGSREMVIERTVHFILGKLYVQMH